MDLVLFVIAIGSLFNEKYNHWFLVILIAFCCNLFRSLMNFPIPMIFPNLWDGALLLIIIALAFYWRERISIVSTDYEKIKRILSVFLIYIGIICFVDLIIGHGITIVTILKTSRHWLLLMVVFVMPFFSQESFEKAIKICFYIVAFLAVDLVLESITGVYFLTNPPQMTYSKGHMVLRGAMPIPHANVFILMLVASCFVENKIVRWILICVMIFSSLVSITRSVALCIIFALSIYYFIRSNNKLYAAISVALVCVVAWGVLNYIPGFSERFSQTRNEIKASGSGEVEGSSSFRLLLTQERLGYLGKDPVRLLVGIGNVLEENFPKVFTVGLLQEDGEVAQIQSGDIAWPNLFLRLGIIGVILYLIFIYRYLSLLYHLRSSSAALAVFSTYVVLILFGSFSSSNISSATFWMMPIMLANYFSFTDNNLIE